MQAIWQDTVLAESDNTVVVESNHYFPRDSIKKEYFEESKSTTHCPWKGDSSYLSVKVGEKTNVDAAWFYADPKAAAGEIRGRVAFWRGVVVKE
jgi:uncharacterized protein (DUF427 family)